eukprot:TRINITY_DN2840_c0_g1_i1.p1 TRINITY_DN2840_c0_g1~~TRINITY_DN2840_c0_g1_i1.p1  ORF type:complete len:373 (-),score=65.55 TRINITY_DN2840_c0_g1_i1:131-1249(-)
MDGPLKIDLELRHEIQGLIKEKLSLITSSKDKDDNVLSEYVIVMVANQKTKQQVADSLEAFLGQSLSAEFTQWLWNTLDSKLSTKKSIEPDTQMNEVPPLHPSEISSTIVQADNNNNNTRTQVTGISSRLLLHAVKEAVASTEDSPKQTTTHTYQTDNIDDNSNNATYNDNSSNTKSSLRKRSKKEKPRARDEEVTFTVTLNGVPDLEGSPQRSKKRRSSSPNHADSTVPDVEADSGRPAKKVRCSYWPFCKRGDECVYYHPVENCSKFPNCAFGDKCLFIHPSISCKFGSTCNRIGCQFHHPQVSLPPLLPPSQTPPVNPCRFGTSCSRPNCYFWHPVDMCKFGSKCARGNCRFRHPVQTKSLVNHLNVAS